MCAGFFILYLLCTRGLLFIIHLKRLKLIEVCQTSRVVFIYFNKIREYYGKSFFIKMNFLIVYYNRYQTSFETSNRSLRYKLCSQHVSILCHNIDWMGAWKGKGSLQVLVFFLFLMFDTVIHIKKIKSKTDKNNQTKTKRNKNNKQQQQHVAWTFFN